MGPSRFRGGADTIWFGVAGRGTSRPGHLRSRPCALGTTRSSRCSGRRTRSRLGGVPPAVREGGRDGRPEARFRTSSSALNHDLVRRLESGAAVTPSGPSISAWPWPPRARTPWWPASATLVNDGELSFQDPVIAVVFEAAGQAPRAARAPRGPGRHGELSPAVPHPRDGGGRHALAGHGGCGRRRARGAVGPPVPERDLRGARARPVAGERRVLRALGGGVLRAQPALPGDRGGPRGAHLGRRRARRARRGADGGRHHAHGAAHAACEHAAAVLAARAARPGRDGGRSTRRRRADRGQGRSRSCWPRAAPAGGGLAGATPSRARPGRAVELWPFNERVLEAALDRSEPAAPGPRRGGRVAPRAHRGRAPVGRPTARRRAVRGAFLAPYRRARAPQSGTPAAGRRVRTRRTWLDPLLGATGDACLAIRYAAIERCSRVRDRRTRMVRAPPLHEAPAAPVERRSRTSGGCDEDLPGAGGIPQPASRDGGRRHRGAHPRRCGGDGDEAAEVEARQAISRSPSGSRWIASWTTSSSSSRTCRCSRPGAASSCSTSRRRRSGSARRSTTRC